LFGSMEFGTGACIDANKDASAGNVYMYTNINVCIYTYIHIYKCVYILMYMYVYTCIYIHSYIRLCTCIHVYICTYVYTHMYIHMRALFESRKLTHSDDVDACEDASTGDIFVCI